MLKGFSIWEKNILPLEAARAEVPVELAEQTREQCIGGAAVDGSEDYDGGSGRYPGQGNDSEGSQSNECIPTQGES